MSCVSEWEKDFFLTYILALPQSLRIMRDVTERRGYYCKWFEGGEMAENDWLR